MTFKRLELKVTEEHQDKLIALCPVFKTGNKSEIVRQLIDREYAAMLQANKIINPTQTHQGRIEQ